MPTLMLKNGPSGSSLLTNRGKADKVSRMKKIPPCLRLALAVCLALPCVAPAATLQILTLDQMTAGSSAIVQGRIVASRAAWINGPGSLIYTFYTVQAESYMKGNLGRTFELTEPGGQVGNIVGSVPGAPQFQVGERAVFFAQSDPKFHQVIGYEQGAFRVRSAPGATSATVNHSQPLAGGGQIVASDEIANVVTATRTSRDLGEFLKQVSESVRRTAAGKVTR